jgi:vacuolar-type H+-ATPase subunit H
MAHAGLNQTAPPTPSADLALLVSTELELDERLNQARERARITVESAYVDAGARSQAEERALTEASERSKAEVEVERDKRTREVLAEGERQAARFDTVPDAKVALLAEVVVNRLLHGVGE